MPQSQPRLDRTGVIYALGCYLTWGVVPLYWKLLKQVPAPELLAHRVIWSTLLYLGLVLARPSARRELRALLRTPRRLRGFLLSAALISANWGIYIHAVISGQVLESSLGYFINPLVNVALGRIFLGERLDLSRKLAFGIATLGVLQMVLTAGHIPWIALWLAMSFGVYGLVRKRNPADALVASSVEASLLAPVALVFLLWPAPGGAPGLGAGVFSRQGLELALLVFGGTVTAFPLYWFVQAARRLPLSSLGFFQYLAPLLQFTLAVAVFHEPFPASLARGFLLIWVALAVFTWGAVRARRVSLRARA